jgi:metal-dependent amidase/aminoacylase/carboxypeptidase family protein
MSSIDEILAGYGDLQAAQEAFYQDLHSHPELSHAEHRTAQRVAGQLRDHGFTVHAGMLDAIQRIVRAECQASGSPKDPEFETIFSFPVTDNDAAATDRVAKAFAGHFGEQALEIPPQTVSEDFSKIPDAAGVPYTYWAIGFTDRKTYLAAEQEGRLQDLPTNHSAKFLPPLQPTLRTGTEALVAAALAWLAP